MAQDLECLRGGQPFALHQHTLGLLDEDPAVQGGLELAGEPALLGSVSRGHKQPPEDAGVAADRLCLGL